MGIDTSLFAEWRIDARQALRRSPATLLTMLRGALTLALFVGGAYLIDQRSTYLGVFALSWSVLRVAASGRGAYARRAGSVILDSWIDLNCNARIELGLRIDNIIGHEAVRRLFDGLKQAGRLDESVRWEEWRDLLIETYQKQRAAESDGDKTEEAVDKSPVEHVAFQIRGGQVWKNGAVDFTPCLHHELLVPHDSLKSISIQFDYSGLYIRAFVVHGMLRLQVGRFGEAMRESDAMRRREWETVTSFPLLWCPSSHRLPLRLLFMDNSLDDDPRDEHGTPNWRRLRRYHKQLGRDAESYRLLVSGAVGYFRRDRLEEKFYKRFSDWLRKENFDQPLAHNDDYYSNDYNYYENEYLGINLRVFDADSWSKRLSAFWEWN